MRVAIGALMQETNSFAPTVTHMDGFDAGHLVRGEDMFETFAGTNSEIAGFIEACHEAPDTLIAPLVAANANAGGVIATDTHAALRGEMVARLEATHRKHPVNLVLLALHGSMCALDDFDPEGGLLTAVRSVVGPDVIVSASLDMHANVTQRMVDAADILVGYRTIPHVDQRRTGIRVARPSLAAARGGPRPRTVLCKAPMILPAEHMLTSIGPMHEVRAAADWYESEGHVLAASLFGVQPWLDVPEVGCAAATVAHEFEPADRVARELAGMLWDRRDRFEVDLEAVGAGIDHALATAHPPMLLIDSADSPSSGSPGDSTAVLQELIARDLHRKSATDAPPILLTIVDPRAAAAAHESGDGMTIDVEIGGLFDPARSSPVQLRARVERLTDGHLTWSGAAYTGLRLTAGPTAVLAAGRLRVLVVSAPIPMSDPILYLAAGLDPTTAQAIQVKSPSNWRTLYRDITPNAVLLDTPGASSANLRQFERPHTPRPMYPLDTFEWNPHA